MPHIDPVRLIFGLILIATILGLMTWISGRSFFTLLGQEDKSPGIWFYIFFTGALALAALGFLIAGTILWIPFFF